MSSWLERMRRRPGSINKKAVEGAKTKKIGGRAYLLRGSSEYRGVAKEIAESYRHQGREARVVRMSKSYIWTTGRFYGVYVR